MKRTALGLLVSFFILGSATLRAQEGGAMKDCIAAWTTSCTKDCATPRCVAECTLRAHDACAHNLTAPQTVFIGPVTAALTSCAAPPVAACAAPAVIDGTTPVGCSTVNGTVANPMFWGGNVTIYVICPPGTPAGHGNETSTVSVIGTAQSSCTDGKFTMTATNSCAGQTGCYGLIAVTPPASCETCGTCSAAAPGDPGWNTCTAAVCPNP